MRRPIDQSTGDRRAVTWKADDFARSFDRTEVQPALHRYAGRVHSLSCLPKRSSVDKRYFAEINRYEGDGVNRINLKLGTGDDPVAAALDGYRQVEPDDIMWTVFELELQAERLRRDIVRRVDIETRLDHLLDDLTDMLRSYNVPMRAAPGEDDDL